MHTHATSSFHQLTTGDSASLFTSLKENTGDASCLSDSTTKRAGFFLLSCCMRARRAGIDAAMMAAAGSAVPYMNSSTVVAFSPCQGFGSTKMGGEGVLTVCVPNGVESHNLQKGHDAGAEKVSHVMSSWPHLVLSRKELTRHPCSWPTMRQSFPSCLLPRSRQFSTEGSRG